MKLTWSEEHRRWVDEDIYRIEKSYDILYQFIYNRLEYELQEARHRCIGWMKI